MVSENSNQKEGDTANDRRAKPVDILLAEDNPNDVTFTKRAFKKGKINNTLHVVNDGVEAMEFLRQQGEYSDAPRPNIVLLDLEMPRKDGKEVLADIESDPKLKPIPVVVLTSSDAERDIIDSYKHSANAYLNKPVGYQEFQDVVRQVETFWLEIVKLPPEN